MAFDGFITKSVVSELKNSIIGSKINKILEPTKNDIILNLYNNGLNYSLSICVNPELCRVCLTSYQKTNPQNPYNFCMLLRKYLIGGKIIKISNYDLERTIEIKIECYNELNDLVIRKLFIEIMSRQSNVILTNEKNIIIDTLKHFDNSRELLPAHEYTFTNITKQSFLNFSDFNSFINYFINTNQTNSLSSYFSEHFIGFSKTFINETLKKLNINDIDYSNEQLNILFNYLKELISNLGTSRVYCQKISSSDYTIFYDNNINNDNNQNNSNQNNTNRNNTNQNNTNQNNTNQNNTNQNNNEENSLKINYFLDDFYYDKEQEMIFKISRNNLLKIVSASLKKVYKKLENINLKLKECKEMDKYRLYGELLTANLYKVDSSFNYENFTVENYYENNRTITIPLDVSISVQKNIEKYFKKYNKLKNALSIVSIQKVDAEKELDYIESIVFNLSNAKSLNDLNEVYEEISQNIVTKKEFLKKEKIKKSNQKISSEKVKFETVDIDGFTIYIGKNNIQNDYLSLKFSNPNDIWFHTQKIHGSHILLRNPEILDIEEIPENVLYNCAYLAKQNSKAASSLNVPVDYCLAKFVKKVSGAKPGMVVYNNFKTIIVK